MEAPEHAEEVSIPGRGIRDARVSKEQSKHSAVACRSPKRLSKCGCLVPSTICWDSIGQRLREKSQGGLKVLGRE